MNYLKKARRVFEIEIAEIQRLHDRLDQSFQSAVDLMLAALERKGKIVVIGVGKSGHIGEKIAATLTSTGSPAVVLNALNALHGDLGVVSDGDVILALSYSGKTEELNNIIPALARFDVKIISITGNPTSLLAVSSDVHLDVQIEQEACPLNLAPTSSTSSMLVLGDALAMVILEARGFNREDFARFHPGGNLGRSLLLKVDQIMRHDGQLAFVAPEAPVREALHAMAQARSGAAVITDKEGRLRGIFTHGDFGRHFQTNPDLLEKSVGEFMTKNPISIRSGRLAAEVLRILEQHPIDDLVVLDDDNRPVGLVDSQDLSRFKLL